MQTRSDLEKLFPALYWLSPFALAVEIAQIMRTSLKAERALGLQNHYSYSQTKHAAMLRAYEKYLADNRLPRPSNGYNF